MTAAQIKENPIADLRRNLISNGYHPVACNGKRAVAERWTSHHVTADEVDGYTAAHPYAANTGILADNVVGVDIDAPDPATAEALISALFDTVPAAMQAPCRTGKAPKCLYLFRATEPQRKVKTGAYLVDGHTCQVELFGIGSQFVAFGVHPDTGKDYAWANGDPLTVPADDLPAITPDELDAYRAKAEAILAERGERGQEGTRATGNDNRAQHTAHIPEGETTAAEIEELLSYIHPDCHYDDWTGVLMAVHAALGEDGLAIADAWSATGKKYRKGEVELKWRGFKPGGGIGMGTLADLARQGGANLSEIAHKHRGGTGMDGEAAARLASGLLNGSKRLEAANDNKPAEEEHERIVTATAWSWVDPAAIPPRDWLYGFHYIRKYVSVTISPGGIGKTSKGIVEALSMASGRELIGDRVHERARVWLINEDPRDELDRRIAAACKHYGIGPADIEGWLFVDSFRDEQFKKDGFLTAKQTKEGTAIVAPFRAGLAAEIKRRGVDVLIVDPFVSSHAVSENDNMAIDLVLKQFWAPVIEETNIAVELIHHSKKLGGNEVTAESARGAVALIGAARSAMALNGMSADEANKANVDNRHAYFRATDAKANMAPRSEKSRWYKIEAVDLCNATPDRPSDKVGVVTEWAWPDTMAGITPGDLLAVQREIHAGAWKDSIQAKDWAGHAVAKALDLDLDNPVDKERAKACLKSWKASGALKIEHREDTDRKKRPFVVVGEWAYQPADD